LIWKGKKIPTYNVDTKEWTITIFEEFKEYFDFVESQWSLPGQYNLKNTNLWRKRALKFQTDKRYSDYEDESPEGKSEWAFEKHKIGQGVIFKDGDQKRYISGYYYNYLNYHPIVDKVKGKEDFAEVWDGQYHYLLYCERAYLRKLNAAIAKARQKGLSLIHTSILLTDFWFVPQSVGKMIGHEEDYVNDKGSWKFLVGYRNFLNENTPWYRTCEPDETLNWEQKRTTTEGTFNTKKTFKGLRSKLIAATSKKSPAKAVGGHITKLFCEEAGIAPNLDKVLTFAEAATQMGGVKTGQVFVSGAVGELKDCKPLEDIALNPRKYGFFGVEDTFSEIPTGTEIAFFFPDYWNYLADDPEKGLVRCYDEDGNSNIELAKQYLTLEDTKRKKEDNYTLWKSQHPWNLQDAFAIRETNIFPTEVIRDQQLRLMASYKPLTVELYEEDKVVKHKFIHGIPVTTLNVDPNKDNSGCVEVDELPIDNPPWGLYYAGVDPIKQTNTVTSKSLMSISVYKSSHYKGDKLIMDYPVARYTGRHKQWEETYRVCLNLMKFYNCRTAIENNITGFIEWCVGQGYTTNLMRRREIVMLNEMVPNSTIRDEIGVRMEGELKKKALEFAVTYVDEIIGTEYEEDGTAKFIYGVSRIKDKMLLEEMLKFTPKLNTDRLIAFILAVMAARSNTNRNIIADERETQQVQKKILRSLPSQFNSPGLIKSGNRLPSPFRKR